MVTLSVTQLPTPGSSRLAKSTRLVAIDAGVVVPTAGRVPHWVDWIRQAHCNKQINESLAIEAGIVINGNESVV